MSEPDRLRVVLRELLDAERAYRLAYVSRRDAKSEFDRLKSARWAASEALGDVSREH